jgi:hypothetical protein
VMENWGNWIPLVNMVLLVVVCLLVLRKKA